MNMKTKFIFPIFVFLAISIFSYHQGFAQHEIFTDSLSHNVIENVYKEEPKTVSNDSTKNAKEPHSMGIPMLSIPQNPNWHLGQEEYLFSMGEKRKN